jgi:hypothetical protein
VWPQDGASLRPATAPDGNAPSIVAQEPFLTNLMTLVLHTEHFPLMAGRPFLSTTSSVFVICRFALHLTQ